VAAAILASSCCVIPLVLVLVGVSGAWIGNLTALEPYKPYFVVAAFLLIGIAFWHVYWRPRPDCDGDAYCAKPASSIMTRTALWFATGLVIIAATVDWWAPLFY
jgi:mercuric ion transport protein